MKDVSPYGLLRKIRNLRTRKDAKYARTLTLLGEPLAKLGI